MTDIERADPEAADRIDVPATDAASPGIVIACDVLADGGLKLCGYDPGCGRAYRAVLRCDPGGDWFVEDRLRFVGLGAPYDRAAVEARGERSFLAWAALHHVEAGAVRERALREAQGRTRSVDETRLRRARNSRRQAEVQDRLASGLAGQLVDRVGRSLDGFPVTFEMVHRGVPYDVVVSQGEPMLRIRGGSEGVVAIGWDGNVASQAGPVLPSQPMRSLALQSSRRRPELLQAMGNLLKARWAAVSHRAEADRLDGAQPQAALPDRAGSLPVEPPTDRVGWHAVAPRNGDRLQVCLHDLREARQVHALVEPADGGWAIHGAMSALSFRTGRREELHDPDLAGEIARLAESHVAGSRAGASPSFPSSPDPYPDEAAEDGPEAAIDGPGPDEPDDAPGLEPSVAGPAPETGTGDGFDGGTDEGIEEGIRDHAAEADATFPHGEPPTPAATEGPSPPHRIPVEPTEAGPPGHRVADPDADIEDGAGAEPDEPPPAADASVAADDRPPMDGPAPDGVVAEEADASARAPVDPGPALADPIPLPVPVPVPSPAPEIGPVPEGTTAAEPWAEAPRDHEADADWDDADPTDEPDLDATLIDPGDLPEDDLDALDRVMAGRTAPVPARTPREEALLAHLRGLLASAERLRESGEPYPDFPYEQRMSSPTTHREMIVRVTLTPTAGFSVESASPVEFQGRMLRPGCSYMLNGKLREANRALLAMEASGFAFSKWCQAFRAESDSLVQERLLGSPLAVALKGEYARLQIAVIERRGAAPR